MTYELESLLSYASRTLAMSYAQDLDQHLTEALNRVYHDTRWTLPDLQGRLKCVSFTHAPDQGSTYYLDDTPLLRVLPLDRDLDAPGVTLSVRYEMLVKAAANPPTPAASPDAQA